MSSIAALFQAHAELAIFVAIILGFAIGRVISRASGSALSSGP